MLGYQCGLTVRSALSVVSVVLIDSRFGLVYILVGASYRFVVQKLAFDGHAVVQAMPRARRRSVAP